MTLMSNLRGGTSRFAHFAGLARASRRAEDEDDKNQGRAAEDEDDDKSASEDDDDKPSGKRGRNAEDDDDGKDASDDDDKSASEDDDDKPSGKRGRKAEDDEDGKDASEDDDEDEMKGKSASAQARRREQSRIAHILGSKAAASNPLLAVSLACETRMTRKEAVAVLKNHSGSADQGGGDRGSRHARQDRNPRLGSEAAAPTGKQAVDASWGAAFGKAGVKVR